jgi:hypothetical protein
VTDEELMQFADRTLGAAEHARVARVVEEDPVIRRRLDAFLGTGRELADPYTAILNAPVPRHLVNIVVGDRRSEAARPASAPRAEGSWMEILGRVLGVRGGSFGWTPAVACGAVVAGVAIGWFAHDRGASTIAGTELVALRGGRIVAQGALANALETSPSRLKVAVSDGRDDFVKVQASFTRRGGGFCRQYEIARVDRSAFTGIGCRGADGTWQVEFSAPTRISPEADGFSRPVADKVTIAAVLEGMTDGVTFDAEEERGHIERKWAR